MGPWVYPICLKMATSGTLPVFHVDFGSTLNVLVSDTKIQFWLREICLVSYVETRAR